MQSVFLQTPYCGLKISQIDNCLHEIDFLSGFAAASVTNDGLLKETLRQIDEYFENSKFAFDLPLAPQGTEFQRKVWSVLQGIPAGQVKTYGEIARELASSPRAVGNACRKNPLPLIVPCHRVVSAQGIGGFVGQTEGEKISIKQQLLAHEGVEI